MRRLWRILLLAATVMGMLAGCAATAPPERSQVAFTPVASVIPAATPSEPSLAPSDDLSAPPASVTPVPPSGAPTLAPGGRLAIRYSGTPGTQFDGVVTGLFDDGAVVPVPASGVVQAGPYTQTMGEAMVALRVTGTIVFGAGTYRVEILGGHLDGGNFVEDQVLAMGEASGRGEEVRVDYGNIDL